MLSVIIPTIDGREESLAAVIRRYQETLASSGTEIFPVEILTPRNHRNWPEACNAGFQRSLGDIIHYGADDLEPVDGWYDAMMQTLNAGEIPAGHILNPDRDPEWDGEDGSLAHFSRVPALTRDMATAIGRWPEIDYYADIWVSIKARTLGIQTRCNYKYQFIHHWHQYGRIDTPSRLSRAAEQFQRIVNRLEDQ